MMSNSEQLLNPSPTVPFEGPFFAILVRPAAPLTKLGLSIQLVVWTRLAASHLSYSASPADESTSPCAVIRRFRNRAPRDKASYAGGCPMLQLLLPHDVQLCAASKSRVDSAFWRAILCNSNTVGGSSCDTVGSSEESCCELLVITLPLLRICA
jgi:hypothetical protein